LDRFSIEEFGLISIFQLCLHFIVATETEGPLKRIWSMAWAGSFQVRRCGTQIEAEVSQLRWPESWLMTPSDGLDLSCN